MSALGELIKARTDPQGVKLELLGGSMGRLYTDHGLPLDMAFDKLKLTKQQKLIVLHGACQWFIEHKRNSGATEKAVERQRNTNREMVERFIKTGEVGIY